MKVIDAEGKLENYVKVIDLEGYNGKMYVTKSPFDNCQTAAVSSFRNFVGNSNANVADFIEVYKQISKKRQIIVDVQEYYTKKVKALFPNIIFSKKYRNATGTKMRVFLIKLW